MDSFFGSTPAPRDEVFRDYLAFLARRNGTADPAAPYPLREEWLKDTGSWTARHRAPIDQTRFERNYERFDPGTHPSQAMLALLAFVKMNAGEAYGVEVVSRRRHGRPPSTDLSDQVERVLAREETYHTRILVGASEQFGLPPPRGAWRPPVPLQVLIGAIAWSPKALFHPVLLGAEIGGVFTFNWMLTRVGELFREEPSLRETLEKRLMEILVDEIGHIAFNRMMVGPFGLQTARVLAGRVVEATNGRSPEFRALGWAPGTARDLEKFDLCCIPEEVRRRAFFV